MSFLGKIVVPKMHLGDNARIPSLTFILPGVFFNSQHHLRYWGSIFLPFTLYEK